MLGERKVLASAYYGIHTLRALEKFPINGVPISIYPEFVRAFAAVKQAAALANFELGQEFGSYAATLERDEHSFSKARLLIQEINLSATAIGTGLNAPPAYAARASRSSRVTGTLREALP